jgi:hypothetical protein
MKFIQNFILLFIIQFSKIFNIKIKLPNTGDLRRKLFLTNHAINKLKDQISIRLEKNKSMQNYEKNNLFIESHSHEMNFKESSIPEVHHKPAQTMVSIKNIKLNKKFGNSLQEDIKHDMDLGNKVYEFFNENPNHLNLNKIKNEIKTTGYKEINDLIDLLDNHPDYIEHSNMEHFYTQEILNSSKNLLYKKNEKIKNSQNSQKFNFLNRGIKTTEINIKKKLSSQISPFPTRQTYKFLQHKSNSNKNINNNLFSNNIPLENLQNGPLYL